MSIYEVSLKEAAKRFDDRYFSPKVVRDMFGLEVGLPPIPFSPELLERLSDDCLLVCYHSGADGKPFRLNEMTSRALSGGRNVVSEIVDPFYLSKADFGPDGDVLDDPYKLPNDPLIRGGAPRGGWQLVSRTIAPWTKRKHLIETVDDFVKNTEKQYFGGSFPEGSALQIALSEWNPEGRQTRCDSPCIRDDSPRGMACRVLYAEGKSVEASRFLATCKIIGLVLEPLQNTVYRFLLSRGDANPLFAGVTSRTSTPTSHGMFATFGQSLSFGGYIGQESPEAGWSHLGSVFSLFGQDIVPMA